MKANFRILFKLKVEDRLVMREIYFSSFSQNDKMLTHYNPSSYVFTRTMKILQLYYICLCQS